MMPPSPAPRRVMAPRSKRQELERYPVAMTLPMQETDPWLEARTQSVIAASAVLRQHGGVTTGFATGGNVEGISIDEVMDVAEVIFQRWANPSAPMSQAVEVHDQLHEQLADTINRMDLDRGVSADNAVASAIPLLHELAARRTQFEEIEQALTESFPDTEITDVTAHAIGYISSVASSKRQVRMLRQELVQKSIAARDQKKTLATVNQQLVDLQNDVLSMAEGYEKTAERLRARGSEELPPGIMPEVAPVVASISIGLHEILAKTLRRMVELSSTGDTWRDAKEGETPESCPPEGVPPQPQDLDDEKGSEQ